MNISYAWLKAMLPGLQRTPQEVADMLAMQGAPVDEIVEIGKPLADIRIARVIEAGRHPNADRLSLCRVDPGTGEELQVVCGAPNVRTGGVYPFAPAGAHLPGDVVIRKSKIRGMESQGMLCSARELGLGRDHDGLMELPHDTPIGASLVDVMHLDDARIVVDVTPNRPDLLSHLGVAREVGAATSIRPRLPDIATPADVQLVPPGPTAGADGVLHIDVRDRDLCPRYLGLIIRGVRIAPSPAWLAGRLRAIGLRPINNVVDVTNHVLHELGQPLHAFDMAKSGTDIVVRRAQPGERITTLDGVDRSLQPDMLVIADASRPIAVAGVMGGANSEVDDHTSDIVLECALFNPSSVRATRRALGLSTDASYRFERGVDPDMMETALRRAAALIVEIAGGTVAPFAVDSRAEAESAAGSARTINLRVDRVAQLLGVRFDAQQIASLLEPLGFTVNPGDAVAGSTGAPSRIHAGSVGVTVPGHRIYDVTREEDLIEEIARRHGYDNFPDDLRAFRPTSVPDDAATRGEDRVRDLMVGMGMLESRTLAFAPPSDGDVELLLPLSSAEGLLRRSITPSLLRRVEANFNRGQRNIRLFEIATSFSRGGKLPLEARHIAAVITGSRAPSHWTGEAPSFDLRDVQGVAERMCGMLGFSMSPATDASALPSWAEPGTAWNVMSSDGIAGCAARVLKSAVDTPAWAGDVFALEIDLTAAMAPSPMAFQPLPAYPAVERDLALLVAHDVDAATVIAAIRQSAGPLLESTFPFDVYRGKGVDAALRSIALRLRFRSAERTLTDDEVDRAVARVLNRLREDHGIERRG